MNIGRTTQQPPKPIKPVPKRKPRPEEKPPHKHVGPPKPWPRKK
jgi:hypothetical protein